MTDPERLVTADPNELVQNMLLAAREDAPEDELLQKTLLAVGAGAAIVGVGAAATGIGTGGAAATVKAGGTSLVGIAIKWLGVGAVGGLVTMGAASGVEHVLIKPKAPQVVRIAEAPTSEAPAAARPILGVPTPKSESEAEPPAHAAAPVSAPHASITPPSHETSIAAEVAAIDEARAALAAGNASKTISLLDAYERTQGRHELEQEALYLRMEALSRSGNPAARDVARRLIAQSPNGPHAARARQITGETNP